VTIIVPPFRGGDNEQPLCQWDCAPISDERHLPIFNHFKYQADPDRRETTRNAIKLLELVGFELRLQATGLTKHWFLIEQTAAISVIVACRGSVSGLRTCGEKIHDNVLTDDPISGQQAAKLCALRSDLAHNPSASRGRAVSYIQF
jgi:hypothetical protein